MTSKCWRCPFDFMGITVGQSYLSVLQSLQFGHEGLASSFHSNIFIFNPEWKKKNHKRKELVMACLWALACQSTQPTLGLIHHWSERAERGGREYIKLTNHLSLTGLKFTFAAKRDRY